MRRFREVLKEKYECRASFNKIFKEWDGQSQRKVVAKDIKRISKNLGFDLSSKECSLLLAYEDHKNKGYLLPFELLKFVFGNKEKARLGPNKGGSSEDTQGKSMYERIRDNVIRETDLDRKKEERLQIEDIVRKNKDLIIREIKKIKRSEEKKTSYNQIVQEKYLKILRNVNENSLSSSNLSGLPPKDLSQTQRLSSPERFIEYPPPRVKSQEKKKENGVGLDRLLGILGNIQGSLGRESQIQEFIGKFAKPEDPSIVNVTQLVGFLNEDKAKGLTPKRSRSVKQRIQNIGNRQLKVTN